MGKGAEDRPFSESLFEAADLGLDLNARLELKFDQLKNARCTAVAAVTPASGCQEGFPTPVFGEQFEIGRAHV